jgi:hypothetical protein
MVTATALYILHKTCMSFSRAHGDSWFRTESLYTSYLHMNSTWNKNVTQHTQRNNSGMASTVCLNILLTFLTFMWQTVQHRDKLLTIKPTRCTNFSNLFFEWNSTCFGQFLRPSSGVFHCTHSHGMRHTGLRTGWNCISSWSCLQAVRKPVGRIPLLCVQWKTPDDGQRNCPKHVEFHSKIRLRN